MDELGIDRARLVGHSFGGVIAMHAAVLAPERVEALVLSDPYFPALRHLEDVSRWGHWQNFREEAEEAGVTLSDGHWYDLGKFFDQVLHLDGERLLRFRQAVGLPALNRLLRLARTTCGDDSKVEAGLTAELIAGVPQPCLALYGETRRSWRRPTTSSSTCRTAGTADPRRQAPRPGGEPGGFVAAVREFLESLQPAERHARSADERTPIVLLTGAANGIGRATALALARTGVPLGLIDIDAPGLESLAERASRARGDRSSTQVADVSERWPLLPGRRGDRAAPSGRSTCSSPARGSAR